MKTPAVRSELLRLREDLRAALDGRDLLDQKREAILRAIADQTPRCARLRAEARERLEQARASLAEAQLELGRAAIDAAALAQPPMAPVAVAAVSVVGVQVPHVLPPHREYRASYGPASGSARLDRAGAAFLRATDPLVALAAAETGLRRLRAALARTARRLNALDKEVVPGIAAQIRTLAAALEEEERDEAIRRRMWQQPPHAAAHSFSGDSPSGPLSASSPSGAGRPPNR